MTITDYWSKFFGIDAQDFEKPGIHIVPHASLGDYWGVWMFTRHDTVIISSPDSFIATCNTLLSGIDPTCFRDIMGVSTCFNPYTETIIGPAYHGSLEADSFKSADISLCREITFQEACTLDDDTDPIGWGWSGCGKPRQHYFGAFQNSTLVAASNYVIKDTILAFPGVFVHPAHRGQGLARSVLSIALQHSLAAGLLLDYQTLCENVGAIKAAESLGVRPFAQHSAIRLKAIG